MKTKILNHYAIPMYVNAEEITSLKAKMLFSKALREHERFLHTGVFCMDIMQHYQMAIDAGVEEAAINLAGALLLQAHLSVNYEDKIFFAERLQRLLEPFIEAGKSYDAMSDITEVTKDALYIIEIMNLWGLANVCDIDALACQELDGYAVASILEQHGYISPSPREIINQRGNRKSFVSELVSFEDTDKTH